MIEIELSIIKKTNKKQFETNLNIIYIYNILQKKKQKLKSNWPRYLIV